MVNENNMNNGDQSGHIMINSNSLESVPSISGDVCTDKYFILFFWSAYEMRQKLVTKKLFFIYFSRMAHDLNLYQVFIQQLQIRQQRMKSSRVNWKIPIEILQTLK